MTVSFNHHERNANPPHAGQPNPQASITAIEDESFFVFAPRSTVN
jgi:hypothetical protein